MKRLWFASFSLVLGITVFGVLHQATVVARQNLAAQNAAWLQHSQQLVRLQTEQQQLTEHLREIREQLAALPPPSPRRQLVTKVLSGAYRTGLSATEREQLRAELGFNWNTTGDYLIISKASLAGIEFDGMDGNKLTRAALGTLAITPVEQSDIEALTGQLEAARIAWAKEHVQRTEPSGDVLAEYTLPVDSEFAQTQLTTFTNGVFSALGSERAAQLVDHSGQWVVDVGMSTSMDLSKVPAQYLAMLKPEDIQSKPTILTLKRSQSGDDWHLDYTLEQTSGSISSSASPGQPFRVVFPGGWAEIAQREHFELPKEFKKGGR
jgi:hypothetical protein